MVVGGVSPTGSRCGLKASMSCPGPLTMDISKEAAMLEPCCTPPIPPLRRRPAATVAPNGEAAADDFSKFTGDLIFLFLVLAPPLSDLSLLACFRSSIPVLLGRFKSARRISGSLLSPRGSWFVASWCLKRPSVEASASFYLSDGGGRSLISSLFRRACLTF